MNAMRTAIRFASVILMVSTASSLAHAQRIGLMAGSTFANIRGADDLKPENRTGTIFGLSLQLPLSSSVTLQPELLFLNKGAKFKAVNGNSVGERSVKLDYFEAPLLLRLDFARGTGLGPHVYVGPSVGFNVGCSVKFTGGLNTSSDCKEEDFKPKTLDYGLTVGVGIDLNLGGLSATGGARYGIGLADIRSDNSTTFKERVNNGVLAIYVGIALGRLGR